jgi:hypothetical protein
VAGALLVRNLVSVGSVGLCCPLLVSVGLALLVSVGNLLLAVGCRCLLLAVGRCLLVSLTLLSWKSFRPAVILPYKAAQTQHAAFDTAFDTSAALETALQQHAGLCISNKLNKRIRGQRECSAQLSDN